MYCTGAAPLQANAALTNTNNTNSAYALNFNVTAFGYDVNYTSQQSYQHLLFCEPHRLQACLFAVTSTPLPSGFIGRPQAPQRRQSDRRLPDAAASRAS